MWNSTETQLRERGVWSGPYGSE